MKRSLVIHPVLAALYPALALYSHNIHQTSVEHVLRSLVVLPALACALWLVFRVLCRDTRKAALLSSICVLAIFSWGHFVRALVPANLIFFKGQFFVGYLAVTIGLLAVVWSRRRSIENWTRAFNVGMVVLLALPLGHVLASAAFYSDLAAMRLSGRSDDPADASGGVAGERRDIYLIVLDSYPRADVLRDYFAFDNRAFLKRMADKGFFVIDRSRSNYNQSLWSMSSCFNMTHLHGLASSVGEDAKGLAPLVAYFRNNKVFALMRKHGYLVCSFATGFDYLELDHEADVYLSKGPTNNEFESLLIQLTPWPRIIARLKGADYFFEQHRERVRFVFEELSELPLRRPDRPKFVYAHVVAPHEPLVFGPHGEPVQLTDTFLLGAGRPAWISEEDYRAAYLGQLQYVNQLVEQAVDEILERSARPPIIAVISDHGLLNPPVKQADILFKNLIMLYLPGMESADVGDSLSLVNLFPKILRHYFGESCDLADDECYLANWDQPYRLEPVRVE